MQKVANRLNKFSESQTLAMAKRSREMKAEGIDVISLSIGEPDFDTPDFIKEAAYAAIKNNFTHYTPVPGYLDLRQAISKKFKRDNNLTYTPEQIVVSTGAKQSLANSIMAVVNEGDEVLVPAPYFVSYIELIKLADGVPVIIPTTVEADYKITAAELEKYITPKTRMVMFSSPCNPSGSVYTKAELKEIALVIAKYPNIIILSDEIYEHINFKGAHTSIAEFPEVYEQTITINGLSKGFAMTGWRIGYIGAPLWIAKGCEKIQGQFTSGTCSIAQRAAIAAVEADVAVVEPMRNEFKNRRDLVIKLLLEINGLKCNVPDGAFYAFPDVSAFIGKSFNGTAIKNSTDLSLYLLNEMHVATVSGDAFGNDNCIRLSYACSQDDIRKSIARIKKGLEQLQ